MSKNCVHCEKKLQEQKHKIELLETRLKDVLRAYKVINKERDDLQAINASITSDVDLKQQKRLAELEENVLNMSAMVGKFEFARKKDKEEVKRLEDANRTLQAQVDVLNMQYSTAEPVSVLIESNHSTSLKNKSTQCDVPTKVDVHQQTESYVDLESEKKKLDNYAETAIVAPIQRETSFEESHDELTTFQTGGSSQFAKDDDNHFRSVTPNLSVSDDEAGGDEKPNSGLSLFYANELARKDIDLAKFRLRIREYECATRELEWKYNNEKYRLQARITDLENLNSSFLESGNNDRQQCRMASATNSNHENLQQRPVSTVNVAYIKNVLTKLLETKDKNQKQVMINALITALNSMQ